MRNRVLWVAALLVAAVVLVPPVEATSWVAIPLWKLVDQADVIVAGKVARIEEAKPGGGVPNYEHAMVEVSEVLKGPAGMKDVRIRQLPPPAPGQPVIAGLPLRYNAGTEGIWLLKKDAREAVYGPPSHPSQIQPKQQKEEIAKLVKARANLPGGKPAGGLVARAELEMPKQGNVYQVWFSLKNVSDKPIVICDYVANQPLQVDWIGPDQKKRQSKHYAWLDDPRIGPQAPLNENHFITIPPGGVYFLGPRGEYVGITLTNPEPGEHKLTIGYGNKEGKKLGLKEVWTDSVTANEVVVRVK